MSRDIARMNRDIKWANTVTASTLILLTLTFCIILGTAPVHLVANHWVAIVVAADAVWLVLWLLGAPITDEDKVDR